MSLENKNCFFTNFAKEEDHLNITRLYSFKKDPIGLFVFASKSKKSISIKGLKNFNSSFVIAPKRKEGWLGIGTYL